MSEIESLKSKDQAREVIDCFKAELCGNKTNYYDAINQFDDEGLAYLLSSISSISNLINNVIQERSS
jgi:hypothetical protein